MNSGNFKVFLDVLWLLLLMMSTSSNLVIPTVQTLPTTASLPDQSLLFRYRTNFFDVLRFKSRLARSPTRNVAAVLATNEAPVVETTTFSAPPPTTAESATVAPEPDGIEIEETGSGLGILFNRQCGVPSHKSAERQGRIVGGEVVHHGEFPWMASLLLRGRHYCGAVILNQNYLLTAAHCLHGASTADFTALLGSVYSLSSTYSGRGIHSHLSGSSASSPPPAGVNETEHPTSSSPSNVTDSGDLLTGTLPEKAEQADPKDASLAAGYENLMLINIDAFIIHENFTRTDFFRNDIALVKLSDKVAYNDFISPVCLPVKVNFDQEPRSAQNGDEMASLLFDREENEILQGADGEKRKAMVPGKVGSNGTPAKNGNSYGPGTVVGWGAIEKYGDNGASRGFLKELSKKKFAVVRNERNLTQVIKMADMDDVLRLRKVELPFIDRITCERWYSSRGRPIKLIDAQFCAGLYEGGKDACRGDSGGPILERLVSYDPNGQVLKTQYQVVGIVSAGIGCALPKLPGIYTRVESYLGWIQDNMSSLLDSEADRYSSYEEYEEGWQRRR